MITPFLATIRCTVCDAAGPLRGYHAGEAPQQATLFDRSFPITPARPAYGWCATCWAQRWAASAQPQALGLAEREHRS